MRANRAPGPAAELVVERVDWLDHRAIVLRDAMEAEMSVLYADSIAVRSPEHQEVLGAAFAVVPVDVVAAVLCSIEGQAVGQAGLRRRIASDHSGALEVKKVFVAAAHRGRGVSRVLMAELEAIAAELGAPSLILQTGDRQPAAMALYESLGYVQIGAYRPFELMDDSLCYEKAIPPRP